MTYEQIETFLTVVTCGNITAAANELFVTQSTVSSRIQSLENELGAPLLIRAKGHHSVELTGYGQSFVPIASQWTSLWKHTQSLKAAADISVLTIASIDSVNNYTLVRLFNQHIERNPNIKLRIHTHHSNEIHGLVQNRIADIGFAHSSTPHPGGSRRLHFPAPSSADQIPGSAADKKCADRCGPSACRHGQHRLYTPAVPEQTGTLGDCADVHHPSIESQE